VTADARVLSRVVATDWRRRPKAYREQVCAWLTANGIDPNIVTLADVEVVLLDAPAIRRIEYVPGTDRRFQHDAHGNVVTRVVHSLLRVPLPEHLADPT
jgi:hypothetical protein